MFARWLKRRIVGKLPAEEELNALSPEQLAERVRAESHRYYMFYIWVFVPCIFFVLAAGTVVAVCMLLEMAGHATWFTKTVKSLQLLVHSGLIGSCIVGFAQERYTVFTQAIAAAEPNSRLLGVSLLCWGSNPHHKKELTPKLVVMLREAPSSLLSGVLREQAGAVRTILQAPYENTDLTLAVLEALGRSGVRVAPDAVEFLASRRGVSTVRQAIQQAAKDCLAAWQVNAEGAEQAVSLLRASEQPATTPDTLLRAAHATTEPTPSEQLLRPGG